MMQGLVLDASAPLYGRAQEIVEVKPLGMAWLGVALNLTRPVGVLGAYSIWEEAARRAFPHLSAEDILRVSK